MTTPPGGPYPPQPPQYYQQGPPPGGGRKALPWLVGCAEFGERTEASIPDAVEIPYRTPDMDDDGYRAFI